jgi:hypothetical protein
MFAAKLQDVDVGLLFKTDVERKRAESFESQIKSEKDAFNLKNRLTLIFLKYQE